MSLSRAFLIGLVLFLAVPSAFAQDDDLLAPLTPAPQVKGKGKTKPKAVPKRTPPAKVAKTPKKGKKPGKAAESEEDALLAPLVEKKPELVMKLSASARGARVFLDDKEVALATKGPIELEPGEHTVLVRKPGFREFSKRITATAGQVSEVAVQLEALTGFVSIKADVPGSRVFIDGEDRGTVPLENLPLPTGSHEISVQQKGFRPDQRTITVRVGKDYTIEAELRPDRLADASSDQPRAPVLTPSALPPPTSPLTPEPPAVASTPLTQRWYFWAGVGAVVVAAAVGTVVATQPLDSSKVCGGHCDGVINPPAAGLLH